ncbi:hypothetical protein IW143_004991, partial [Coemansia sp. RSA 520]
RSAVCLAAACRCISPATNLCRMCLRSSLIRLAMTLPATALVWSLTPVQSLPKCAPAIYAAGVMLGETNCCLISI